MTLRTRDRQALLVLGIFLIGAAVYVYWFEPLTVHIKHARRQLESRQHDLRVRHQRVRELRSWESDYESMGKKLSAWMQLTKVPDLTVDQAKVLEALRDAAGEAKVELSSLRPVPRTIADEADTVVDTFAVEGHGDSLNVADFIGLLWGMDVIELQLTRGDGKDARTTFYLQARLLPFKDLASIKLPKTSPAVKPAIGSDAFEPRRPPPPPAPPAPPPEPVEKVPDTPAPEPPPKPVVEEVTTIPGLRVVGVGKIGGQLVGVFVGKGDRDLIFVPGDTYQGFTLVGVDAGGVTFQPPKQGKPIRLVLPKASGDMATPVASPAPVKAAVKVPNRPPHLGLSVEPLSKAPGPGLRVTKVQREDSPLAVGDVIVEADSVPIRTLEDLARVLRTLRPGETLTVRVRRHGKELDLTPATY